MQSYGNMYSRDYNIGLSNLVSYKNMRHVLLDIMDFFEIKTEYEDVIEVCTCIV